MKNKKKNNIIDFPTSPSKLERQVEAILFAAAEPLDVDTIESKVSKRGNYSFYYSGCGRRSRNNWSCCLFDSFIYIFWNVFSYRRYGSPT